MKIWRASEDKGQKYLLRLEERQRQVSSSVDDRVRKIVAAVARRGDRALVSFVRQLDLKGLPMTELRLQGELAGNEDVGEDFASSIEVAITNLKAFHAQQAQHGYTLEQEGAELGIRVRPIGSVGVYVSGGAAASLSSLLMAVVPAQLAGVPRIAVATPPRAFLSSPSLRYVLERLGIHEVYLMGGVHAVAALAYGTESVTAVDKIVGSGGRWVAAAKRAVFGVVDIDGLGGPSEVVVIADAHAEAEVVAADMLAQAEHDSDATAVLVTTSRTLAEKVDRAVTGRLRGLGREVVARESIKRWGAILLVDSFEQALEVSNRIAPEHVQILVEDPRRLLDGLENAGAIYLGPWSSTVLGDFVVGTNHVLPTAGTARFASPLGVWDFVHRTAVVRVHAHGFAPLARAARALALQEMLPLHAEALRAGRRGKV
ncbi:MAG: histidinol dehydrogenase [Thermoanaerobaculaceae bacterium]|nr:histidinol dehydrogenase [Thermoanaerobaculaceae bacterium]MDI9621859.1 histidinol dehydrogenase [Acidobacteriota bacterium]NLH11041.1 histidinol dehydrogenase [Holophagae bacterium]HPW54426.1 histidinol dehydrogenase [Thermoanaerobaculaceae bacterium]